jgi:acyl-ACP thioesterase
MRKILVRDRVIENNKPFWALNNLTLNVLPGQFRTKFFSSQITIEGIMTKLLTMFCKIRLRIIDLTDQQVLAIIQAADYLGSPSHPLKLISFAPVRQSLSFA